MIPSDSKNDWYRLVFEQSLDPIIVFNANTKRIADVNPATENVLKMPREELIGLRPLDLIPENKRSGYSDLLDIAIRRGGFREMPLELLTREGRILPVVLTIYFIKPGEESFVIGIFHILERPTGEEIRCNDDFHILLDKGMQGIYQTKNGIFTKVNRRVCEIFGYPEEKLLGMPSWNLARPDLRESIAKTFFEKAKAGDSSPIIVPCIRSDGREIITEISINTNREFGVIGFITDVTERENLLKEIGQSEANFRLLAESSQDVVMRIGLDYRCLYVNAASRKITGYAPSALIDKTAHEAGFPKELAQKWESDLSKVIRSKQPLRVETLLPNGRWIDSFMTPEISGDGAVLSIFTDSRDITQQKESEAIIQKNLEENIDLYDNAPCGYHSLGPDGTYLRINNTELNWLGYKREELVGKKKAPELMTPESKKTFFSLYPGFKKTGKLENIELEFVRKDGTILSTLLNATAVVDDKGHYINSRSTLIDNSKMKQYESELKSTEEKFRGIANLAFDMIYQTDIQGRFTYCSPSSKRLFGYPDSDVVGKSLIDFVPKEEIPRVVSVHRQALSGKNKTVEGFTCSVRCKDGSFALVEVNALPLIKNGKIIGSQGIIRDVSQRKQAEARLAESEKFLSSVIENIPDMIFVKDAKDLRLRLINHAGEKLLGRKREALIGKIDYDLFPRNESAFFTSKDRAVLDHKKLVDIPEEPINSVHGLRYLHTKKIPLLDDKGNPKYLLGISEDITKTKELDLLTAGFISSISHELRTPITPIKAQVQRLLERELPRDDEKKAFEVILRNTIRLDRLIQDILEINRIQAGRLELHKKDVDLNDVIRMALTDLNSIIKANGTKVTFVPGKIPVASIDSDRMLEVIINLVDNSIKYGRGKIRIRTKKQGSQILVSVTDNGIGIPKSNLSNIFKPFYRTKQAAVQRVQGTGLGLSIVKGILATHGGMVWVESKVGKGTTVSFTLPGK